MKSWDPLTDCGLPKQNADETTYEQAMSKRSTVRTRFVKCVTVCAEWGHLPANFLLVFPYGILYTIERDFVLIVAVMHLSREPEYWRHRLTQD